MKNVWYQRAVFLVFTTIAFMMTVLWCTIDDCNELINEYNYKIAMRQSELEYYKTLLDRPETEEDNEPEEIAKACIMAIGTNDEYSCFGYDVSKVLRIITQEVGGSTTEDIHGVVQAMWNTCVKSGGKWTPEDVCNNYHWTHEAKFISYEVKETFIYVFIYGDQFEEFGEATIFYNPNRMNGEVPMHENYPLVKQTKSGIRFFEFWEE